MHMADALISPAVGLTMWAVAGGSVARAVRRLRNETAELPVPRMGLLGAFVFAAQMINFSIPGTGSSGHLAGGLLLTLLLGSDAAILVMAAVLTIQALLFADGGLLALGCNIVNMAVIPSYVAYPLVYRPLAAFSNSSSARRRLATVLAAIVGVELGAFAVVVETLLSGVTPLSFATFAALMLPIHLAIGLVEGIATVAVVEWLERVRPETVREPAQAESRLAAVIGLAALFIAGILSWLASSRPDGLEWSLQRTAPGWEESPPPSKLHAALARVQQRTSWFPDYDFTSPGEQEPANETAAWPAVSLGTSLAGVLGSVIVLGATVAIGLLVRPRSRQAPTP